MLARPPGVVDEQIDRLVVCLEPSLDASQLRRLREICGQDLDSHMKLRLQVIAKLLEHLATSRDNDDLTPAPRKLTGERFPDSGRGSCHECPAPSPSSSHPSTSPFRVVFLKGSQETLHDALRGCQEIAEDTPDSD